MKFKSLYFLFIFLAFHVFLSNTVVAQPLNGTLLISDVDDTIKQSNVQSTISALLRARDDQSRFLGMSELYHLIGQQQNPAVRYYYVSNAPERWMEKVHLRLLKNGNFPDGTYHPRKEWDSSVHKINTISRILLNQKPQRVLFFGDNSQKDATIYDAIEKKFAGSGIQFHTFIRIVYAPGTTFVNKNTKLLETVDPVRPQQFAFVTPVEVSMELHRRNLVREEVPLWMINNMIPFIVKEREDQARGILAFPNYVDCRGFRWPFNTKSIRKDQTQTLLAELQKKILSRCSKAVKIKEP